MFGRVLNTPLGVDKKVWQQKKVASVQVQISSKPVQIFNTFLQHLTYLHNIHNIISHDQEFTRIQFRSKSFFLLTWNYNIILWPNIFHKQF